MKYFAKIRPEGIIPTPDKYNDVSGLQEIIDYNGEPFVDINGVFKFKDIDVDGTLVPKTQEEMDAEVPARVKGSVEIFRDILNSFTGQDLEDVFDAFDKMPSFGRALDGENYDLARARLAKSLQRGQLTQAQHDTIDGLLP